MTPTLTFVCSICGEPSVSICVYCTKDACPNHICERCSRCSDCCECDIRLDETHEHATPEVHAAVDELQAVEPDLDLAPAPPEAPPETTEPDVADSAPEIPAEPAPLSAEPWTAPEVPVEPQAPDVPSEQDEKPEP